MIAVLCFLNGPDGLSSSGGRLYLCCEGSGTVLSFDSTFSARTEYQGLASPEGICVTPEGRILITEDTSPGRILSIKDGEAVVLASGLGCPEGIALDPFGNVWFTTGGLEAGELFTSLWRISGGEVSKVYSLPSLYSFSDLEISADGTVFICSETSELPGIASVYSYEPVSGVFEPFCDGVSSCEGICLTQGFFPMYLVSEHGLVFSVDSSGTPFLVCEVPGTLEDVAVFGGDLYVSEDSSGSVIRLIE